MEWTNLVYVLVMGWPGSGKTTLARALGQHLGLAVLSKDELKEALVDQLGMPTSVPESERIGRAAAAATLRAARTCPGAVIDSVWKPYSLPLVLALPGRLVEVCCHVSLDVAKQRFAARGRHAGHLDEQRSDEELWGHPVRPLGVGPVIDVYTGGAYDIARIAADIRGSLLAG